MDVSLVEARKDVSLLEAHPLSMETTRRSPYWHKVLSYDEALGDVNHTRNTTGNTSTISSDQHTEPPPETTWLLTPLVHPELNRDAINSDWKSRRHNPAKSFDVVIPRMITKVFLSKKGGFKPFEDMLEPLKRAHKSWIELNPGYDMQYFDLTTARKYLHTHFHPVFLRAFDCIEAFAGKNDLFRLAVIYREGGWYSDWKEECLVKGLLEEKLAPRKDVVYFMDKGVRESAINEFIMNGFLGAIPRHPFFAEALKQVLRNVQQEFYGEMMPTENTGPGVLGRVRTWLEGQGRSDVFEFDRVAGKYKWNFYYLGRKNKIIRHKCTGCNEAVGRGWGSDGNDYWRLHKERTYYCQDARSLFSSTL